MSIKKLSSIVLIGLLSVSACVPMLFQNAPQVNTNATTTKIAGDFYATQTAVALPTILQEMANATATKMAGDFFATQTAGAVRPIDTSTPISTPISTPTFSTSTGFPATAKMSMNVRSGPNSAYPIQFVIKKNSQLTILGQAYGCSWYKIMTQDEQTGWISATGVNTSVDCKLVAEADFPPQPTVAPTEHANNPPPSGCDPSSFISITNNTTGSISIDLSGPANYHFDLPTGTTNVSVCAGSYFYTAYGCGSPTPSTGSVNSGGSLTFYCG
jgi:hypothetical protein